MKVTVNTSELVQAIRMLGLSTATSDRNPEYSAVELTYPAPDSRGVTTKLAMFSTDSVLSTSVRINTDKLYKGDETIVARISLNLLSTSVRNCSEDTVELDISETSVKVRAGRLKVECPTRNEFSIVSFSEGQEFTPVLTVPYGKISSWLKSVNWLATAATNRPSFTCPHIRFDGGISFTASNTWAIVDLTTGVTPRESVVADLPLPGRFVSAAERLGVGANDNVTLSLNEHHTLVKVSCDLGSVVGRTIDAPLPSFDKHFALRDDDVKIRVDRDEIRGCLDRVCAVSSLEGGDIICKVSFDGGEASVERRGSAYQVVDGFSYELEGDGDPTPILLDVGVLARAIRVMEEGVLSITIPSTTAAPIVVRDSAFTRFAEMRCR